METNNKSRKRDLTCGVNRSPATRRNIVICVACFLWENWSRAGFYFARSCEYNSAVEIHLQCFLLFFI